MSNDRHICGETAISSDQLNACLPHLKELCNLTDYEIYDALIKLSPVEILQKILKFLAGKKNKETKVIESSSSYIETKDNLIDSNVPLSKEKEKIMQDHEEDKMQLRSYLENKHQKESEAMNKAYKELQEGYSEIVIYSTTVNDQLTKLQSEYRRTTDLSHQYEDYIKELKCNNRKLSNEVDDYRKDISQLKERVCTLKRENNALEQILFDNKLRLAIAKREAHNNLLTSEFKIDSNHLSMECKDVDYRKIPKQSNPEIAPAKSEVKSFKDIKADQSIQLKVELKCTDSEKEQTTAELKCVMPLISEQSKWDQDETGLLKPTLKSFKDQFEELSKQSKYPTLSSIKGFAPNLDHITYWRVFIFICLFIIACALIIKVLY